MSVWLLAAIALHLAGLVVTFSGARFAGRVLGLVMVSAGAGLAVVVAPPDRSWPSAVTVALTLLPLVVVVLVLWQRVQRASGSRPASLDDDAL